MPDEWIQFLLEHEHDDPIKILLQNKRVQGYAAEFVANQIDCRRRAKEKLPLWYANPQITYPNKSNLEQCSSELTARFKSDFIRGIAAQSGDQTVIDLTAGFGVDSFFLSRIFKHVIHVEPDAKLIKLAQENHIRLGAVNIKYVQTTAEVFLHDFTGPADWVYVDPSRKALGKKVVKLSDCEPDVIQLLHTIWSKTSQILIKTAPLLDIKEGLRQLPNAARVFVTSVGNECREVLFQLQKDFVHEPDIICVNIQAQQEERFTFQLQAEVAAVSSFSEPQEFLYEPNASILKAGAFKKVGEVFGLLKLAVNTHLYTSNKSLTGFPGRVFKILGDLSEQASFLPDNKANIISRNHPLGPDEIKKKYKLKDGGERYVIACSSTKKKHLLVAERMK